MRDCVFVNTNTVSSISQRPALSRPATNASYLRGIEGVPARLDGPESLRCLEQEATWGGAAGFADRLLRPDDVHDGVYQCQVGERLREIAKVTPGLAIYLLGIELQGARVREQLLAELAGTPVLADHRPRRHQPERADRQVALLAREPVVGLVDAVTQHQPVG